MRIETLPRRIWEPAAGKGDMASVLSEADHFIYCSDRHDYLSPYPTKIMDFFAFDRAPEHCSCIVTNPPFSIAGAFVRHALSLVPKVYILGRLAFLEGARRSDILDGKLARIWVFKERPRMMHRWSPGPDGIYREWDGKKSDSAMPFAWFCFESGYDGTRDGISVRRVSWREPPSAKPKK